MKKGFAFACASIVVAACGGPSKPEPKAPPSTIASRDPRRGNRDADPSEEISQMRDPSRPARALVFRAPGFPTVDAPAIDGALLDGALAGLPITQATSLEELRARLDLHDVDVLVLPYGSSFPVDAWPRIKGFLDHGGGLAVLGGAPFHVPIRFEGGAWTRGPRQSAFAHDLRIGPAEAIPSLSGARTRLVPLTGFDAKTSDPKSDPRTTWALTLRTVETKDMPEEHGSSGPREAIVRPLAHVVDGSGTPRGCPLLEIDHRSGGRWLLATTDGKLDAPLVRAIVSRALEGASELTALPSRASVEPGDTPRIRISARRFFVRDGESAVTKARVRVNDASGHEVFSTEAALDGPAETRTALVAIKARLAPGLYHVLVEAKDDRSSARVAKSGFWIKDDKLLASAPKIGASRDWLRKNGKAFPVVGTTYMASDVHRKFLFEPNPSAWDADFAEMKRQSINFVRTGLWTAWSRAMLDPGAIDEGVLSALEAYVMTAARHGIVVCFDFFAFLPPSYGAANPYLDPRALAGQRELLTLVASRFRNVGWIHWDLINEPSYAPHDKLWKTRAIGDEHEKLAFRAWSTRRHGGGEAAALEGKLRAIWRDPGRDVFAPPRDEDFAQAAVQADKRPRKTRDFVEFTQDVVTDWAAKMRAVLRASSGEALVTLGQDEGGIFTRPTQQLMAPALDYTSVHTWWNNDDLLWDGVLTKASGKPSLHQETGLMRLEDLDGTPWRSPEAAAALLERKLGYAFAARGAGVVEWAWNINPTMPIDEESTIGLFRPDGTAKPELDVLARFARFAEKAAPHLDDFDADPVVLVVPHARAFLGMTGQIDATKIVVRALAERFGVVPAAVSDLRLRAARLQGAKLVIVPCASAIDEDAAKALLDASRAGAKVLVTGAIDGDSYGLETPSLRALGLVAPSRPVAIHEKSGWSSSGSVSFEGAQEWLKRAEKPSVATLAGPILHEPLPLELAREREPLVKLLEAALAAASVVTMPGDWGLAARVLYAGHAALVVVVNERPETASRRVIVDGRALDVAVRPLGARVLVVDRKTGASLADTGAPH